MGKTTAEATTGEAAGRGGDRGWIMGAVVVGFFAAFWAWTGAGALPRGATAARAAAVIVSLGLVVLRATRAGLGGRAPVRRGLLRATIAGEVAALWIMGWGLGAIDRPDLLLSGLAIIVGLHFFPMARALGVPAYHATAAAMTAVGLISLAMPEPARTAVVGFACAAILWITMAQGLPARSR